MEGKNIFILPVLFLTDVNMHEKMFRVEKHLSSM